MKNILNIFWEILLNERFSFISKGAKLFSNFFFKNYVSLLIKEHLHSFSRWLCKTFYILESSFYGLK